MSEERRSLAETCAGELQEILSRYLDRRSALLPVLQLAQREYGWISDDTMREVARVVG